MRENPTKKELPRCKHMILEGTCSLCLGYSQEGSSKSNHPGPAYISERMFYNTLGWADQPRSPLLRDIDQN